ncbi:putative TRAP C4-dicarboxylate transport system permease, DctM subunit (large permease component) [Magnetospirillum gryphiswaldense MSR-1 v2]|uniref:TRAP transporter large permease protein n=1 Tax=Magnetospirillum gryphiswaldense (strain DSM 6361 / JCM 21280 / NBRC 15271 / MSR-1) TaxID=431944 RepID=V6F216_MAGGM|nr:TRAP transporter large permease subunit [Magnetospirillum gryphiswaldense]CDK98311.1 putative TRAP C4-dicarboxylate transport system permease, DctM subunit (large permease component) [Magnetospirillum gryphiswaldense MSR-1 v2]
MTAFIIANMAPLMFGALVLFLLCGYPVAFALGANGLLFGLLGMELGLFHVELFQALPERVFGIMRNETLLAIPFFTFMGLILERSGMAEDLLDTIGQLFGPIRGGLAYAVIFVGALLAATTGVVAASVISMGLISLPIMLRYGYDPRLATGVIAASGTLAQIIPPSLVLIIMADQLGRSVGDMYQGAMFPGLVLTAMYAGFIALTTIFRPSAAPALPLDARTLRGFKLVQKVLFSLVPPLVLIFLVLGTIFIGVATPTEAGAMGAAGALILAVIRRRLSVDLMKQAMESTAKLSSFVLFILIGSTVFGLVFRAVNGDLWVEHLLTGLPGGVLGFLIVVNILVFVLAFFLDFFELAFIIVPLLGPVAEKLGIDLIWFGVLLAVNMQTSFMHPPFGFALFFLRSVAPKDDYDDKVTRRRIKGIKTTDIYWGAIPFVCIQIIMVGLVIAFPSLVEGGLGSRTKVDVNTIHLEIDAPAYGAPESSDTPSEEGAAEDAPEDPMEALKRQLQEQK